MWLLGESGEDSALGPVGVLVAFLIVGHYLYLIVGLGSQALDSVRISYVLNNGPVGNLAWIDAIGDGDLDVVDVDGPHVLTIVVAECDNAQSLIGTQVNLNLLSTSFSGDSRLNEFTDSYKVTECRPVSWSIVYHDFVEIARTLVPSLELEGATHAHLGSDEPVVGGECTTAVAC